MEIGNLLKLFFFIGVVITIIVVSVIMFSSLSEYTNFCNSNGYEYVDTNEGRNYFPIKNIDGIDYIRCCKNTVFESRQEFGEDCKIFLYMEER